MRLCNFESTVECNDSSKNSIGTLLLLISVIVHSVVSPLKTVTPAEIITESLCAILLNVAVCGSDVAILIFGSTGSTSMVKCGGNFRSVIAFSRQFDLTPRVCVLYPCTSSDPCSIGVPCNVTNVGIDGCKTTVSGSDSNTTPFVSSLISATRNSNGSGFVSLIEISQRSFWTHWNARNNPNC